MPKTSDNQERRCEMEVNDVIDTGEVVQDSIEELRSKVDEAKLWKLEITQALAREQKWRTEAIRAYSVYTPESQNSNAFNIFWSNTETLSQAVFNSLPSPVVKRRYDDADPIGKAAAITLQRAIAFPDKSLNPFSNEPDTVAWFPFKSLSSPTIGFQGTQDDPICLE